MGSLEKVRRLRRDATSAEQVLWGQLRNRRLVGYKFRRQHPVGSYIVDFVCFSEKLVVELDGVQHQEPEQMAYDQVRTAFLEAGGYRILRFNNCQIISNLSETLQTITYALKAPRPQGEGVG
ncbi:MAG: DUF559 domain-containing protein [Thiolinea sp.]